MSLKQLILLLYSSFVNSHQFQDHLSISPHSITIGISNKLNQMTCKSSNIQETTEKKHWTLKIPHNLICQTLKTRWNNRFNYLSNCGNPKKHHWKSSRKDTSEILRPLQRLNLERIFVSFKTFVRGLCFGSRINFRNEKVLQEWSFWIFWSTWR